MHELTSTDDTMYVPMTPSWTLRIFEVHVKGSVSALLQPMVIASFWLLQLRGGDSIS